MKSLLPATLAALSLSYLLPLSAQTNLEEADWGQVVPELFLDPTEESANRAEAAKRRALQRKQREDERKWREVAEEIDRRQQEQQKAKGEEPQPLLGELAEEQEEDSSADIRNRMIELRQQMRRTHVELRMHRSRAKFFNRQARRLRVTNVQDRQWAHHQARQRMQRVHALERNLAEMKKQQDDLVSQLVD